MVIGSSPEPRISELNVCKKKHLTNTRSSSADEALTLVPPKILSLEQALDFIDVDELPGGYTGESSYPQAYS